MTKDLGARFAEALAAKDTATLTELLAPDIDFKALTPRKFWDSDSTTGVLEVLFDNWFEEQDHIEGVEITEGDPVADTAHVAYRLAVTTPDGPHVVEQQAYFRAEDGRIGYLRVLCSGYRPVSMPPIDDGE